MGSRKEKNPPFPALLVTVSVSFSPQAGPYLITGTISIFWCYFGAHQKKKANADSADITGCLENAEALGKMIGWDLYF